MLLPGSVVEEEQDREEVALKFLWSAALKEPSSVSLSLLEYKSEQVDIMMAHLGNPLISHTLSDVETNKLTTARSIDPEGSKYAESFSPSSLVHHLHSRKVHNAAAPAAALKKKRCGRNPSNLCKKKKKKRLPLSDAKARLRSYECRSRIKREHTIMTMRKAVADMEARIRELCKSAELTNPICLEISKLMIEATHLAHDNYSLRKALDTYDFFHSMLQLEYENRETPAKSVAENRFNFPTLDSWCPIDVRSCHRLMRDSFLEIEAFSKSEDFRASDLELCGWHEKRKLVDTNVTFMFHKQFAQDCSEDLAARSWDMRAKQDQVSRYFGHSLKVKVKVLQRFENDVVVVRRKMKHTVDGWMHHTIYLLFRSKTLDGHVVCIRDMNPADVDDVRVMTGSNPTQSVIWSKAFIWWKFTMLPEVQGERIRGFEVEYGGSLSSATSADAAFWMREVMVLALRWENLVVGPLLTLS